MQSLNPLLLADDGQNDIELTLAALAEDNLADRVVIVRDGAEVLDYLYGRGAYAGVNALPVVILLDIEMPKVDGIEVLRTVKSDPALKKIPVVMLTSSGEAPDIEECYRLGANAYVVKPVDFREFFDAIKMVGRFWGIFNEVSAPKAPGAAVGGKVVTTLSSWKF